MAELIPATAAAYAERHTSAFDELAAVAAWTQEHTSSPGMMSGLAEARLLQALIAVGGAQTVLEIGTFTGFGTLAMAAALPNGGTITTVEVDEHAAAQARRHFTQSRYASRINSLVGDALEVVPSLDGPFDLVYIDAWKADYPRYYEVVAPRLAPRGVIVADNLFRGGRVLQEHAADENTEGMRRFAALVQDDDRVENVLLTVGDGLMLAWPRRAEPV